MEKQYAYGDWEVDGVKCPVNSAGLEGAEFAEEVGEEFDDIVANLFTGESEGVISGEQAQEAWQKLIDTTEAHAGDRRGMPRFHQNLLEVAELVKEQEFNNNEEHN